jgi:hypothetical protein
MREVNAYKSLVPEGLLVKGVEIGPDLVFIVARTPAKACACPVSVVATLTLTPNS